MLTSTMAFGPSTVLVVFKNIDITAITPTPTIVNKAQTQSICIGFLRPIMMRYLALSTKESKCTVGI